MKGGFLSWVGFEFGFGFVFVSWIAASETIVVVVLVRDLVVDV